MLGSVELTDTVLVADLEAGLGTLSRLADHPVDALVVVVEPTAKSLEVGVRALELAAERNIGEVVVVANRVREESDVAHMREALGGREVVAVPDDSAVIAADRAGDGLLDAAPDSPAVQALLGLTDRFAALPS